jgi:uncharacterized membrane protein YeaQ/YmgE (transglycosylase-associated protein family)
MKFMIYLGITVGSVIGSYIPVVLFHVDMFSVWSILMGAVGSFVGLWVGYRIGQNLE